MGSSKTSFLLGLSLALFACHEGKLVATIEPNCSSADCREAGPQRGADDPTPVDESETDSAVEVDMHPIIGEDAALSDASPLVELKEAGLAEASGATLASDGAVDGSGQTEGGTLLDSGQTSAHADPLAAVAISAGESHTCVVLADGSARCWGSNRAGQLGNGATGPSQCMAGTAFEPCAQSPVRVVGLASAKSIAAGAAHTCALLRSNSVTCWGHNENGELGIGRAEGPARCAFLGTEFECSRDPVAVPGLEQVRSINAASHTCALLEDGTTRCWGSNFFLFESPSGPASCGESHAACALVPTALNGLVEASALDSAFSHSCAIVFNGVVQCWGSNLAGQLGDGTTTTSLRPADVSGLGGALAVVVGGFHSCAIRTDRTVACWGDNRLGQVGLPVGGAPDQCMSSSIPATDMPCTRRPRELSSLTGVTAISAGGAHTCALLEDTTVHCWGANDYGQLGLGSNVGPSTCSIAAVGNSACSPLPRPVPNLSGVIALSSGDQHTCALRMDGSVRCWGSNMRGQLGNGSNLDSATPVDVRW